MSYSRRDAEFVHVLSAELERRGKSVWIDTEGIGDGEVFPDAIRSAIEGADAFVFVITPDSVASRFCATEVEYAVSLHKRVVPVLRRPVPDEALPDEIRFRSWLPFDPGVDTDVATDRLVAALDTDLEYVRSHTRWLVKAIEWESERRDRSFLLRGSELRTAERWLSGAGAREPEPTVLQRDFVEACSRAASRRQRRVVAAAVVVAAASLVLLAFALISRSQAQSEARSARSRAWAGESQAQLTVDPERSILLAMAAVREAPTPESVFALRGALDASSLDVRLPDVGRQATQIWGPGVSYSPDGRRLAEGSQSGDVTIFAIPSGTVLRRVRLGAPAPIVQFSPDGSLLAVGTDQDVVILDASTGANRLTRKGLTGQTNDFAFSADGSVLYLAGGGGVVRWDLRADRTRVLQPGPIGPVGAEFGLDLVTLSQDGRRLVVGGWPGLALLDPATGRVLATAEEHRSVFWASFSPDGSQLAVASGPVNPGVFDDGTVELLDGRTLARQQVLTRIDGNTYTAVAFSPDGSRLAYGGGDGSAGVYELPSGVRSITLPGHVTYIYQVAFSPDGRELATAAGDGTTLLWRVTGSEQLAIPVGRFDTTVNGNVVPADLRLLRDRVEVRLAPLGGAGRGHEEVGVWSLLGRSEAAPLAIRRAVANGLGRLSDDGRVAVTIPVSHLLYQTVGAKGAPLQVWDVASRRVTRTLVIDSPVVDAVTLAVRPDDAQVAFGVVDDNAQYGAPQAMALVDLATGGTTRLKPVTSCGWLASGYSPDGRLLAAGDACGKVDVWDTATARQVGGEHTFSFTVNLVAPRFSPDGSRLAVANTGNSGQVSVLDVASGQVVAVLTAHPSQVQDIAYSPDGKLLATASIDHTVRVWDARTGRALRILQHPDAVDAVAFGPTSGTLATLDYAGTIRLWDACTDCEAPDALLALAGKRVTRQLTAAERRTFLGN